MSASIAKAPKTRQQSIVAWVLSIVTALAIGVASAIMADTVKKFLSPGTDSIGFFVLVVQATIAAIGGGALATTLNDLLRGRGLPSLMVTKIAFVVSILVLGGVFWFSRSLPQIARSRQYYPAYSANASNPGGRAAELRQLVTTTKKLQQAVQLDPDFMGAHFRLALAYSDAGNDDKALTEFQTAAGLATPLLNRGETVSDGVDLDQVFVNLAFAQLAQGKYAAALPTIDSGLRALPESRDDPHAAANRYVLYLNRAWANLGLKYYARAEDDLREAEKQLKQLGATDGAGVHCIRAQVAWSQHKEPSSDDKAKTAAESARCLDTRPLSWEGLPQSWIAFAREYRDINTLPREVNR